MKIFPPTQKTKIGSFIFFLILLGCTGWFAYFLIPLFGALGNDFGDSFFLSAFVLFVYAIFLFIILFCIVITIWVLIYANAVRKARLIFSDRTLTFEFTAHLPSLRKDRRILPFSLPYEQIREIRLTDDSLLVEIIDVQGKIVRFAPTLFGENYGENVLAELKNRFPTQKIQSGADIVATQKLLLKKQRKALIPYLIVMLFYFATVLLDPTTSSRPWVAAWDVEFNPPWLESVWGYAPAAQGEFWIVGSNLSYYRIYHFPDKNNREWKLPDSMLGDEYPDTASQDNVGNPIVWSSKEVLHYTNGNWEIIPLKNGLTYSDWQNDGCVSGEYAWGVYYGQFIKVEALTGAWSVIPLPNSATSLNLSPASMRQTPQGDILVLMQNKSISRIYIYERERWTAQEYPVIILKNSEIWDYFLDSENRLWALFGTQDEFIVERVQPSGDFDLTELPAIQDNESWRPYRDIFIDSHERIWVTEGSYPPVITVFQPIWKSVATQVVRYTRGNSNYKNDVGDSPIMMADGKIWGFDDIITSLDTNQENLPAPLPDWFGNVDWNMVKLYTIPFQLIAIVYQTIQLNKITKQFKQRNQIQS